MLGLPRSGLSPVACDLQATSAGLRCTPLLHWGSDLQFPGPPTGTSLHLCAAALGDTPYWRHCIVTATPSLSCSETQGFTLPLCSTSEKNHQKHGSLTCTRGGYDLNSLVTQRSRSHLLPRPEGCLGLTRAPSR